jgi:hypothetical protein
MTGARTGPPGKRQRRPGCSRAALKTQNQIIRQRPSGKSEITAADAPMTESANTAGELASDREWESEGLRRIFSLR